MGALIVALATDCATAADSPARKELAATGRLRVGIAVGPSASALWTVRDAATGRPRGVPIELGTAMAAKLGVPVELIEHESSGAIVAARDKGTWDVTFLPVDEDRKKVLDIGAPYHLLQSTYLVAPGSAIQTLADANRAGVRIAIVDGTATGRAAAGASPNAAIVKVKNPDEAVELMRAGKLDAIALSRESVGGLVDAVPGSRVLEEAFLNSTTAVAVPKGKAAALAYVSAFIEEAKASGLVRRALDGMGLTSSQVAPAGMRP
jgi:polar amino acid transport system substrate-binding protein